MSFVTGLETRMVEKVWGRDELPGRFEAPTGKRIGEIWFEPPPELDSLLVKYLFTSEKLSVQVHPSDVDAQPGEMGKDECWIVLDAQPGARLAIGFDKAVTPDQMAKAALDGTIESLLTWHEPKVGDIFYLPAGTVHAIGPGLSLIEVQQNSDTTFRLYDYGRPRELHLERAIAVARGAPQPSEHKSSVEERGTILVDGPYFRIDKIKGAPGDATMAAFAIDMLALPLSGEVHSKKGQSELPDRGEPCALPGEAIYAPSLECLDFSFADETLLVRAKQS